MPVGAGRTATAQTASRPLAVRAYTYATPLRAPQIAPVAGSTCSTATLLLLQVTSAVLPSGSNTGVRPVKVSPRPIHTSG